MSRAASDQNKRRIARLCVWLLFVVMPACAVFTRSLVFPKQHPYSDVVVNGDVFLVLVGLIAASIGEFIFSPARLESIVSKTMAGVQTCLLFLNCFVYATIVATASVATSNPASGTEPPISKTTIIRLAYVFGVPALILGAIIVFLTTETTPATGAVAVEAGDPTHA
jgi:hypothetical protein